MILLAAVGGSGTMVGFLGWMVYRIKRLEVQGGADNAEVDRILEQVEDLHEHLRKVRVEMGELSGRVDFAERLLTSGQGGDATNREGPPP